MFFSKALVNAIAMQRFNFKNSIIAIKLYIMILNLYLSSEQTPSKSLICGGCALKLNSLIILIQVMKDFESLTVSSVEHYCKVNPAWFTCFKMINS